MLEVALLVDGKKQVGIDLTGKVGMPDDKFVTNVLGMLIKMTEGSERNYFFAEEDGSKREVK